MAFKPISTETVQTPLIGERTPKVHFAESGHVAKHKSFQLNQRLYRMMGKPREITVDIDIAAHAIKFGDNRRANYYVLRVDRTNRVFGAGRVSQLGLTKFGDYTYRGPSKDGSFVLVHEDHPTPEEYHWTRVSRRTNWALLHPQLVLRKRHKQGLMTRALHELMNFPGAFMVEVDTKAALVRIRVATIDDVKPVRLHHGKTASFGTARLRAAGIPWGRYELKGQKDGWYILELTEVFPDESE